MLDFDCACFFSSRRWNLHPEKNVKPNHICTTDFFVFFGIEIRKNIFDKSLDISSQ